MATMMLTRTVHPPSVSNPVIVFLTKPAWDFLFMPTFAGAVVLVLVAYFYNNLVRKIQYPRYW
jgi:CBS-domain-containing membrane protein